MKVAIGKYHFLKNNFHFPKMASFEARLILISRLLGKVEIDSTNFGVIFQTWFLCLPLHLILLTIRFYFSTYGKHFNKSEDSKFREKAVTLSWQTWVLCLLIWRQFLCWVRAHFGKNGNYVLKSDSSLINFAKAGPLFLINLDQSWIFLNDSALFKMKVMFLKMPMT